jgi:uncharacterized protein YjbI with pentapeptide repeats
MRNTGGGATEFGEGKRQARLQLQGEHSGLDLSGRLLCDCSAQSVVLSELKLEGTTWRRSQLRGASLKGLSARTSRWEVIDLESAKLSGGDYSGAHFDLVSFRDAQLRGVDLSGCTFVLCDFSGALFEDVNFCGAQFVGCDFEACVFASNVDFSGADLSGSLLQRAWLGGASFEGTQLESCDFRSALAVADGGSLRAAGAVYRPSRLGTLFHRLLGGASAQHGRVLGAISLTWALLAIALPGLFFARAIMNPIDPDQLPSAEFQEPDPEAPGEEPEDPGEEER